MKESNFSEKEEKLLNKIKKEIRAPKMKKTLKTKSDVYFFLKDYCLENIILLNKEQRDKFLSELEKEVEV
jgi:hypothetical protein